MDNYVLPDYFYLKVANDLDLPREVVEKVYRSYLKKINESLETEGNIYVKSLGNFTVDPNRVMDVMYRTLKKANAEYDKENCINDKVIELLKKIDINQKKIDQVQKKYEYKWELIERSLEKFRSNLGRFEKFFDNKGHYRGDSIEENSDLQQLSIQEEE